MSNVWHINNVKNSDEMHSIIDIIYYFDITTTRDVFFALYWHLKYKIRFRLFPGQIVRGGLPK